ncbi:AlbA family DNA-binding domain-containing protein [Streptomyces brasiliscabiei]|uniref:AlbA family DNA-binding domain-containing protein n=1 Tax=Streptomyces brasiliscabiei TaxID=2736302 RepID=UPI001C11D79E|nr:ATP-binding protein [Streptomyces brasiliscabiei]
MPIYLSSDNPRWTPKTEADLKAAVNGGLIDESNYLDVKKELVTKGDNKELARDMSSFAVDGGTLIVGIGEDKPNRVFALEPQLLDGLAEKVDSVARSIPDPPFNVITEAIPTDTDNTRGYLLVHIPASPQAPHMVDGRYYGRNDKTKHVLTDAEVARLHEQRRSAEQDALTLLQQEVNQDPLHEVGDQSHLFLVAQPLAGRRDMLLELTSAPQWNLRLAEFIQRAYTPTLDAVLNGFDANPTLLDAGNGYRRAGGVARATNNLGEGRAYVPVEGSYHAENAIELQVFESGGLRLYSSRFSDGIGDSGEQLILDAAAVSLTRRFLALVLDAAQQSSYRGNWALAFGATRLRGRRPYSGRRNQYGFASTTRYSQDTYQDTTGTTWAELDTAPGAITRRLIGPLLRGLGAEHHFDKALDDSQNQQQI